MISKKQAGEALSRHFLSENWADLQIVRDFIDQSPPTTAPIPDITLNLTYNAFAPLLTSVNMHLVAVRQWTPKRPEDQAMHQGLIEQLEELLASVATAKATAYRKLGMEVPT